MQRIIKILVVIVALCLLLPYVFGKIVDRHAASFIDHFAKTVNKGKQSEVEIKSASIQGGWFSSKILLQTIEKMPNHHELLRTTPIIFHHGPLSFINGRMMFGMGTATIDAKLLAATVRDNTVFNKAIMDSTIANVHIGFFGGWSAFLVCKGDQIFADADANIRFSSLVLRIDGNAEATDFILHFLVNGLEVSVRNRSVLKIAELDARLIEHFSNDQNVQMIMSLGLNGFELNGFRIVENPFIEGVLKDAMISGPLRVLIQGVPVSYNVTASEFTLKNAYINRKKVLATLSEIKRLSELSTLRQTQEEKAVVTNEISKVVLQGISDFLMSNSKLAVKRLSLTLPNGSVAVNYTASFPGLKKVHTYADVLDSEQAALTVSIPKWQYINAQDHIKLALSNLYLENDTINTALTTSRVILGQLAVYPLDRQFLPANKPIVLADQLTLDGQLKNNNQITSYATQLHVVAACASGNCFHNLQDRVQISNMSSSAFNTLLSILRDGDLRSMSVATQKSALQVLLKLITSETTVTLQHQVATSSGVTKLKGALSWPAWNEKTSLTVASVLDQAIYTFHAAFPEAMIKHFLMEKSNVGVSAKKEKIASFSLKTVVEHAVHKGYLKPVADAYVINVTGRGKEAGFH